MQETDEGELISILERFGLTELEAKIYLELLKNGQSEAKEIVSNFDIHFSQLYGLMSNLERKGYVETQESRPKKYRAADPEQIIREEKEKMEKNSRILKNSLSKIKKSQKSTQEHSIWITRGIQNILYNMEKIIKSSENEVGVIIETEHVSAINDLLHERREEGFLTYLLTYPRAPKKNEVEGLSRIRTFETCPFGMLAIAEKNKALMAHGLPEKAPPERRYGIIFEEPLTPTFLNEHFYKFWNRAHEVVKEEPIRDFPKTFKSHRLALLELKKLLEDKKAKVKIKGKLIENNRSFEEEGTITRIVDNDIHSNFTLETEEGNSFSIGGPYTTLEDVQAEKITLLDITE